MIPFTGQIVDAYYDNGGRMILFIHTNQDENVICTTCDFHFDIWIWNRSNVMSANLYSKHLISVPIAVKIRFTRWFPISIILSPRFLIGEKVRVENLYRS